MLTQDRLKQVLTYNPDTGEFFHLRMKKRIGTPHEGHLVAFVDGRTYGLHRLAWFYMHGEMPPKTVDHINGVKDDNRIANLRLATVQQNIINRRVQKNNRLGAKGVSVNARATGAKAGCIYRAEIKMNGKRRYLGVFKTIEEASAAYAKAAAELHGEFANTG